ncbi:MAG TPA: hypothetical protein PKK11_04195 [Methanothrix sp.]|nr:hypothetical protein [Methanothrix sp.]HPT19874.1 hypothetical protein [Methanothrix sp.]
MKSSPSQSKDAALGVQSIFGEYCYIENPCTTRPCLPGMVYAVRADGSYYYLSVQGHFVSESLSWKGHNPQIGDQVTATGYLSRHEDIFGNGYLKMELISLQTVQKTS